MPACSSCPKVTPEDVSLLERSHAAPAKSEAPTACERGARADRPFAFHFTTEERNELQALLFAVLTDGSPLEGAGASLEASTGGPLEEFELSSSETATTAGASDDDFLDNDFSDEDAI
jgi:hypothetical protein